MYRGCKRGGLLDRLHKTYNTMNNPPLLYPLYIVLYV
jgi:hypothetical protein